MKYSQFGSQLSAFKRHPLAAITRKFFPKAYEALDVKYSGHHLDNLLNLDSFQSFLPESTLATESLSSFLKCVPLRDHVHPDNAARLARLFDERGSDKSTTHNYFQAYQPILDCILANNETQVLISEIGLGTNFIDKHSNMGLFGKPGASGRAFCDYSPRISYFGGDVDFRILFSEDRIETTCVDQLDPHSLDKFISSVDFQLLIDDGLHNPFANLNFLAAAMRHRSALHSSWVVVEDIDPHYSLFWSHIASLVQGSSVETWLVECKKNLLFVAYLSPVS